MLGVYFKGARSEGGLCVRLPVNKNVFSLLRNCFIRFWGSYKLLSGKCFLAFVVCLLSLFLNCLLVRFSRGGEVGLGK